MHPDDSECILLILKLVIMIVCEKSTAASTEDLSNNFFWQLWG